MPVVRSMLDRLAKFFPKSLVSEFHRIFGPEDTEKLLTIFGGTTLKIPSTEDLLEAERDVVIYEALVACQDSEEAKKIRAKLSARFELSKRKVRFIFRRMKRMHRQAVALREADVAVGRHQLRKVVVKKPKRKRRL